MRKHSLSRRVLLHLDIRGLLRSGDFWVWERQLTNVETKIHGDEILEIEPDDPDEPVVHVVHTIFMLMSKMIYS